VAWLFQDFYVVAPSVLVKDHTLSCVLTTCQILMGPGKPSSHVTTSPNRSPCLKDVLGEGMRSRAKTSPVDRGPISMK
jgi:hypothetical protein